VRSPICPSPGPRERRLPEGKTSPEELVAAAHATCFSMALALVLGEARTPPARKQPAPVAFSTKSTARDGSQVPRFASMRRSKCSARPASTGRSVRPPRSVPSRRPHAHDRVGRDHRAGPRMAHRRRRSDRGRTRARTSHVRGRRPSVFTWYIKNYGIDVNLFVDHSQIVQLECLRAGIWGTHDTWQDARLPRVSGWRETKPE
jgi:hypothetical protein